MKHKRNEILIITEDEHSYNNCNISDVYIVCKAFDVEKILATFLKKKGKELKSNNANAIESFYKWLVKNEFIKGISFKIRCGK